MLKAFTSPDFADLQITRKLNKSAQSPMTGCFMPHFSTSPEAQGLPLQQGLLHWDLGYDLHLLIDCRHTSTSPSEYMTFPSTSEAGLQKEESFYRVHQVEQTGLFKPITHSKACYHPVLADYTQVWGR